MRQFNFKSLLNDYTIEVVIDKLYDIKSNQYDDMYVRVDISNKWEVVETENVEIWNDAQRELLFNILENHIEGMKSDYDVRDEQGIFGYGY